MRDARALADLEYGASRDEEARRRQEELRAAYLDWRAEEARRLARAQGITGRLRNGPESFLDEIDGRALRRCPRCDEIAYPDPERPGYERGSRRDVADRCHFCDSRNLVEVILSLTERRA
ncbi:MAG: hypothetical protein JST08_06500 [Actinobacteria bacterium]|nr:hypothetical protein [Actinomycetota bacterium]